MPKPPRPAASEVLRHNLLILVGLPSHIRRSGLDQSKSRKSFSFLRCFLHLRIEFYVSSSSLGDT